jgi:hypothetical protein
MAEFVQLEQFRRQRLASGMALALFLVNVDLQFSGHLRVPSAAPSSARHDCIRL